MTSQEKQFAIDLLKSLDIGMGNGLRADDEYIQDLHSTSRKEILKTVRELMKRGYKHENKEEPKD